MTRRALVASATSLLLALFLAATLWAAPIKVPNKGWKTYRGAWFQVKYPIGFKVQAREPGATSSGMGPDGVSFLSPDGLVELYVYSPQWSGNPDWIKQRSGETVVTRKTEKQGEKTVTWVTFKGPKGAYRRSYLDTQDAALRTRHVFGYKYRNKAAYEAYRPLYLKFRGSLKQLGD